MPGEATDHAVTVAVSVVEADRLKQLFGGHDRTAYRIRCASVEDAIRVAEKVASDPCGLLAVEIGPELNLRLRVTFNVPVSVLPEIEAEVIVIHLDNNVDHQAAGIVSGYGAPKAPTASLMLPEQPPHFQVECLCGGTLDTRRALRRDLEAFVGVPCPECGQDWTIEATPEGPRVQAICRTDRGCGCRQLMADSERAGED